MENPSIAALPVGVIRGNPFLRAAVTQGEVERWKAVFARHGPLAPLVVRPAGDGGYRVVAGERELEAVRELKVATTEAVVVPLEGDTEAHKLSLQLLSLRNSPNHLEEALIIREILKDAAVSQADLAKLCGHSLSWVSKRLSLVQSLEPTVIDLVSRRVLAPATAQEIAKLPPAKQHPFACRVVTDRVPKSVVEKLVSLFNAPQTSDELRQQIIAAPADALDRIRQDAAKLEHPVTEGDDKRLGHASRLLERLFDQITGLLPSTPPTPRQSECIARMRQLTESFLTRLGTFPPSADFPQGN